jgi:predicted phosphoribosyltransferase
MELAGAIAMPSGRILQPLPRSFANPAVEYRPRRLAHAQRQDGSEEGRMSRPFVDRADAGQVLARQLSAFANSKDLVVLALPRGGVPVAFEVARELNAPLDAFVVRKLGVPGQEELAMGAIASGDVVVINDDVVKALKIPPEAIAAAVDHERQELARREAIYRGNRPRLNVEDRTVILIDDGLATGSTMRAAVTALRNKSPARIVVAVPIGAAATCAEMRELADDCVCAIAPEHFRAVGLWYDDFAQTDDAEVCDMLSRSNEAFVPWEERVT